MATVLKENASAGEFLLRIRSIITHARIMGARCERIGARHRASAATTASAYNRLPAGESGYY
jgi:hypothetical protein